MKENKGRLEKAYKIIMLVLLTSFITFMITSLSLYTYYSQNGSSGSEISTVTSSLKVIRNLIDEKYLWSDDIDEDEVVESAIAGYVEGLGDEYTEYISADDMAEFTEDITGSFVGIGIYMIADEESDSIIVYYPIEGSPAEEAGIKSGDVIKSVNGVEYAYEDFDTIADSIKGEAGTKVTIVVERDGEELEFEVTRAVVSTNPITTEVLENNIGYVKVPSFDSGTAESFKEKVEELQEQGCTSLIIDLRNNGGGILDESTAIADYFLEKGKTIITTKDKDGNEETTQAEENEIFDMPLVILANENSASASEVLIGALQDNERATIVGTTTYGKGVIQTIFYLSNGGGLKLTTAEYYTPSGKAIHGVGIEPDVEVELPEDILSIYAVDRSDDTQLDKAIEILTQ